MDARDTFTYLVMLAVTPLFVVVLVASLILLAPVLGPLWLLEEWKKRQRAASS